jgi:hypothetical protein
MEEATMLNITKRSFIFGSATAVAVAALPVAALLGPAQVETAPSPHVFLKRRLVEFQIGFPEAKVADLAEISIFVHRNGVRTTEPLIKFLMNVTRHFRWKGLDAICVMSGDVFEIAVNSNNHVGQVVIIADDTIDEGPSVSICEVHNFPQKGPIKPMFLHADNSLEARIARRDAVLAFLDTDDNEWDD